MNETYRNRKVTCEQSISKSNFLLTDNKSSSIAWVKNACFDCKHNNIKSQSRQSSWFWLLCQRLTSWLLTSTTYSLSNGTVVINSKTLN